MGFVDAIKRHTPERDTIQMTFRPLKLASICPGNRERNKAETEGGGEDKKR